MQKLPFSERLLKIDPRYFQITTLACLVFYGSLFLDLEIRPLNALAMTLTALLVQFLCSRLSKLPAFDPKSALISSLSLCLLLRTNHLELAVLAAFVTIASKFILRVDGRHVFNPTNFGIGVMMLFTHSVWVSPGQWGTAALFTLFLLCAGSLVVRRARRSDVTIAFFAFYSFILFWRAFRLGDPIAIPLHQMQNGAFIIFTFFMISDPKTTPDSRAGRILFALFVAFGAAVIQFTMFRTNGLIWSLLICSTLVPLINRVLPGGKYNWSSVGPIAPLSSRLVTAGLMAFILFAPSGLRSFCGFYVAKADASLYNQASQVVLARSGDRTCITMASDYQGDMKEFAIVIPVPAVLKEEQIRVKEKKAIDHLDAFTAPRLVEYFDANPCGERGYTIRGGRSAETLSAIATDGIETRNMFDMGVTIEAQYSIGEYDILILSARESGGLQAWLQQNGYSIPKGAEAVLGSYIKQNLKFFVAKVNLKRQESSGFTSLRPIQVEFTSPKFMLPIRLGTVNSKGTQDMLVYGITTTGRIETTNYRTVKLPSDDEVPVYVKGEFADFYRAMFERQAKKENMEAVFLEYAWDMGWCDPCADAPLNPTELADLGVFWMNDGGYHTGAYVTRLHVRYDAKHFPEDLVFQETGDRQNFQCRYVLRHPWQGKEKCEAAREYRKKLRSRLEQETHTLAWLTGWEVKDIRKKADIDNLTKEPE